jgi:hypothetical protein
VDVPQYHERVALGYIPPGEPVDDQGLIFGDLPPAFEAKQLAEAAAQVDAAAAVAQQQVQLALGKYPILAAIQRKAKAAMTPAAAATLAALKAKPAAPAASPAVPASAPAAGSAEKHSPQVAVGADPGDWVCSTCKNTNWARRNRCNRCGNDNYAPPPPPANTYAPPQLVPPPPLATAVPPLADGWCARTDPADGSRYFWHPASGATTWDTPFASGPQQDAYPQSAALPPPLPQGHPQGGRTQRSSSPPAATSSYSVHGPSSKESLKRGAPPPNQADYGQPLQHAPASAWRDPRHDPRPRF